ncbi:hypothetical protein ACFLU5_17115, partial [Bacteroidota bacterium]
VDQNGFSIDTAQDSLYVEFRDERIQLVEQTDVITLDIILDTYNSQSGNYVKIAYQNRLRVDISILAGIELVLDL